jgi:hypothetical protein
LTVPLNFSVTSGTLGCVGVVGVSSSPQPAVVARTKASRHAAVEHRDMKAPERNGRGTLDITCVPDVQ